MPLCKLMEGHIIIYQNIYQQRFTFRSFRQYRLVNLCLGRTHPNNCPSLGLAGTGMLSKSISLHCHASPFMLHCKRKQKSQAYKMAKNSINCNCKFIDCTWDCTKSYSLQIILECWSQNSTSMFVIFSYDIDSVSMDIISMHLIKIIEIKNNVSVH